MPATVAMIGARYLIAIKRVVLVVWKKVLQQANDKEEATPTSTAELSNLKQQLQGGDVEAQIIETTEITRLP